MNNDFEFVTIELDGEDEVLEDLSFLYVGVADGHE